MSFIKFIKSVLEHKPSQVVPPATLKPNILSNQPDVNSEPNTLPSDVKISAAPQLQVIKPHVPLIKFRKGGLPDAGSHGKAASLPSSGASVRKGTVIRPTIEDYQLPLKYRRTALDEKEIDYINRGGPE